MFYEKVYEKLKKVPRGRVVKNNGEIGNFSGKGGVKAKIRLLEKEGVKIKNNRIIDFENVLFRY